MFCTSFAFVPLPDMPNKNCEPKQIFRQHPGSGRCGQLEMLRWAGEREESQSQRQLKAQKKKRKKRNKENFSFVALLKFSCAASMAITAPNLPLESARGVGEEGTHCSTVFSFGVRGCRPIWQTMCVIVVISSSSWPSPINSANKCAFKCHLPRPHAPFGCKRQGGTTPW